MYYGDMKPANLLIFRDMRVKISDFGITIQMPENASDDDLVPLKGYTPGFVLPEIEEQLHSG